LIKAIDLKLLFEKLIILGLPRPSGGSLPFAARYSLGPAAALPPGSAAKGGPATGSSACGPIGPVRRKKGPKQKALACL